VGAAGWTQRAWLVFGDTELSQAYLGLVVGQHPALCDRAIDDPSVSRRHKRIGMAEGRPYIEDLNSLNGTLLDGAKVPQFEPVRFAAGQELTLGRVVLAIARSDALRHADAAPQPQHLDLAHIRARARRRAGAVRVFLPHHPRTHGSARGSA
jgi:predicted component of type VI protein secretion system